MTRRRRYKLNRVEYQRWRAARRRLIAHLGQGKYRENGAPEIYVTPLHVLTYFDPAYGTGAFLSNPLFGVSE